MYADSNDPQLFLIRAKQYAQAAQHRLTLVLVGGHHWGLDTAQRLFTTAIHEPALWLSAQHIDHAQCIPSHKAIHYLGQEFNTLIYDGHSGIDVDAIAAISGTLKGGGLFVVLRTH
jgi:tRNA(Met) cytidine acetyltransferase